MLDILAMVSQEQEKSVIQRQEPPPVFDQQQPYLMPLNSDLYHTTNVPLPVAFEPQIDQVGASSSFYSFSSSSSSSLQSLQSSSKPCIGCNSNPRLPNRTLCHTCFRDYQREWNKKNRSATRSTKHVSISSTGLTGHNIKTTTTTAASEKEPYRTVNCTYITSLLPEDTPIIFEQSLQSAMQSGGIVLAYPHPAQLASDAIQLKHLFDGTQKHEAAVLPFCQLHLLPRKFETVQSFSELYKHSVNCGATTTTYEQRMTRLLQGNTMSTYLRDVDTVSIWRDTDQEDEKKHSSKSKKSKKQPSSGSSSGGARTSRSLLQAEFFSGHRHSLLSLLDSESIDLFRGFATPYLYLKVPGCFFFLHVEQLFAPFYNISHQGGSNDWFCILPNEYGLLLKFMEQFVAKLLQLDVEKIPSDDRALLLIPFFAKATFPSDLELQQYGIHVQRVPQASGMVVMGRGVTAHKGWGEFYSVQEAINFVDEHWLLDGLPRCVEFLQWVERMSCAYQRCNVPSLQALLQPSIVSEALNIIPRSWTVSFFQILYIDIFRAISHKTPRFPFRSTQSTLLSCQQHLQTALQLLLDLEGVYARALGTKNDPKTLKQEIEFISALKSGDLKRMESRV